MSSHSFTPLLLLAILLAGMALSYVRPARGAVVWAVSLDANSSSPTDAGVEPSAIDAKSFRVGAVINGTSANPLSGVFGWQFTINYNASAFIAQGDPSLLALYPDGAAATVSFGDQTTTGTVNWAGLLSPSVGCAFGSSTTSRSGNIGQVTVFLTLLVKTGCPATVTISANNLLANVAFELLNKPSTPQTFTVTSVIFVGSTGALISGVVAGTGAGETVTNDPPHARLTATPTPRLGPLAFTFNATASSDTDDSIPRPSGYFWDFGDGSQDLGLTGPVVTHNYTMVGKFNVTLRVQDGLGATGASRDSLGGVILNVQPSHMFLAVSAGAPVNQPPVASFTFSPASPTVGQAVFFDGSSSFDPDGFIMSWTWNFGDGSPIVHGTTPTTVHSYSSPGNFTVTLTVLDNGNATGTKSALVSVRSAPVVPAVVAVDMDPAAPGIQNATSVSGNFALNVDVLNVTGLFSWQFQLNYDNTLLSTQQANVTLGPFWQSAVAARQGFLVVKANQTAGVVLVGFTLLSPAPAFAGTGVLVAVAFKVLRAGTGILHLSNTVLLNSSGQTIPTNTRDGFVNVMTVDQPPLAIFTFSPTNPTVGQPIFFDASRSFDPDGFIQQWVWNFGDGIMFFGPATVEHSYNSPGNFTVTLTVIDNAGLRGVAQALVQVHPKLQHDVAVASIDVAQRVAVSTQFVGIEVGLLNLGLSNETVSLTVYFDSHVISTVNGIFIQVAPPSCVGCQGFAFVPVVWDTSGVAPGNYTISATVFLSTDQNLSNNSKTDGQVTILPPPVLTVTPSSGSLGTKVLVQGSVFPTPQPFQGSVGVVVVTFDDMFLGFMFTRNGRFNFTFDVPHAEPGPHLVKAIDGFTAARASTIFLVLATPSGNLAVSVDAGVLYFPGDTATIYVLTSLNGASGPSNIQLQLLLFKPDGSNATLTPTPVAPGLFKASFIIPRTGSLGTYAILAKAHMAGPFDASALRSFEVKPTWLSQQGQTIMTATAIAGVLGVVAVAWRKGYLRRKSGEPIPSPFS